MLTLKDAVVELVFELGAILGFLFVIDNPHSAWRPLACSVMCCCGYVALRMFHDRWSRR